MPNYETQLHLLEHKGINYHKLIADSIIKKLNAINPCVVLISGDNDFIISHLIAKGMANRKCYLKVIYVDNNIPPMNSFHPVLEENVGDISEYDLIISLDIDKDHIPKYLNAQRFIFFPRISHLQETSKQFVENVSNILNEKEFSIEEIKNAYYCNFTTCFFSI